MSIVSSGQLGNIQSKTNVQASINFKSQNTSVLSEQIYEAIDYAVDVVEDVLIDIPLTILATGAVVATTVISGVAKVVEYVADGVIWLGGTVISWVQDLFGYDTAAEKTRQSTMNTIARDVVGEMNKGFYENTALGRAINEKSAMKYDSELAKTIQNVTVKAVELTAAVALTVATGGLCAPLAAAIVIGAGTLEGIGKSAEERYKSIDPEKRQYQTGAILLDGFGNGLNWYATGKLGSAGINFAKVVSQCGGKTAIKTTFAFVKNSLRNISVKDVFSKQFLTKTLRSGLFDADNLIDSIGIVADNYAQWFNGGELDLNKMMKELAFAYSLNCCFDGFGNLVQNSSLKMGTMEKLLRSHNRVNMQVYVDGMGIENFASIVLARNSLDVSEIKFMRNYFESHKNVLDYKLRVNYEQALKSLECDDFVNDMMIRFNNFLGGTNTPQDVYSISDSFVYKTADVFYKDPHVKPGWAAYNNGTHSVMNLEYDSKVLKSYMTHESVHQISCKGFDAINNTYTAGIKVTQYDAFGNQFVKNEGLNESITEYFNQLIMGSDYPVGNCGYEAAVDKLKTLVDYDIISVDDLKQAYFSNDANIIFSKIDSLTMNGFSTKLANAFDKAISTDINIKNDGLQKLDDIVNVLVVLK